MKESINEEIEFKNYIIKMEVIDKEKGRRIFQQSLNKTI